MSAETSCTTSICALCNGVSWTGNDENKVNEVMNAYPKKDWCSCQHVLDCKKPEYPPKAGTGEKKK